MVLETIYVVRHGHRMSWAVDPTTGIYTSTAPTPTGIPADPQLASYGETQAAQLADKIESLDPAPDVIYSSPFYRCLQTIAPSYRKLRAAGRSIGRVRVENGISEFFGEARFEHPAPATLEELQEHFDFLDPSHAPAIRPPRNGESLDAIHQRLAYALHRVIEALDADPRQPRSVLLCTHAASMICIGRVLTGRMPDDVGEEDFRCGTCALSRFQRHRHPDVAAHDALASVDSWDAARPQMIPSIAWKQGRGVAGGWDCVVNGDCSFLEGGEERSWHFTGDESFVFDDDDDEDEGHDAGATPGIAKPRRHDGAKL